MLDIENHLKEFPNAVMVEKGDSNTGEIVMEEEGSHKVSFNFSFRA